MGFTRPLFTDDTNSQAQILAAAFASKNVWDHRFFKIKLFLYTTGSILATALILSFVEYLFEFNLFRWMFL